MTLLEYITSLQDTGLSQEEIFAKAQVWKKNNPEKAPVEQVKGKDAADQMGATVTSTNQQASESSSSGNGTSYSMFDEDAIASQGLDIINQRAERKIAQDASGEKLVSGDKVSKSESSSLEQFNENFENYNKAYKALDTRRRKIKETRKGISGAIEFLDNYDSIDESVEDNDALTTLISEDKTGAFIMPIEYVAEANSKIDNLNDQLSELSTMDPKADSIMAQINELKLSIDPVQTAKIRAEKLAKETSLTKDQVANIEIGADEFVSEGATKETTEMRAYRGGALASVKTTEPNKEWLTAYENAKNQYAKENNIKLTEGSGRTERDVEITPEMDEGIKALMKSNYVNKQSDLETRNNLESWIDNNRGVFTKSQVQNQQAIYNKITALDLSTKQKTSLYCNNKSK